MNQRAKSHYCCSQCGAMAPKWSGQCGECGGWNTLVESIADNTTPRNSRFSGYAGEGKGQQVVTLAEVSSEETARIATGIGELDRVLGGGLVAGSVILLGGDPGIGKSTLLLQALHALKGRGQSLYVSGEESPRQISLRARRLSLELDSLRLLAETSVERILQWAQRERPDFLVVDSIQTLFSEQLSSAPGSVAQVRECSAQLVRFAKQSGTALFLVGHVTKEGQLAGPRVLEHMVDTVLYFEGESGSRFRAIRAVNELGVFAMGEQGLKEVSNPSAIFLSRHGSRVAGSAIMVTLEGSRPLLIEVQALVDQSHSGNPRRVTLGLEGNRLVMLLAVLHRHGGIASYDQDVFANVVGGVRVSETAADLALLAAIISSLRNRPLAEGLVIFGEVGLAGEIRPVPNGQERLREAAKHGFTHAIVPQGNLTRRGIAGIEVVGVDRLEEVVSRL
jgi:DNA repair protein RadA/Sms